MYIDFHKSVAKSFQSLQVVLLYRRVSLHNHQHRFSIRKFYFLESSFADRPITGTFFVFFISTKNLFVQKDREALNPK